MLLSDDRTRIVGYPGQTDLRIDGELPYPVALKKGYYLDNRGIQQNTAFLKLTYQEYEKLQSLPSTAELYALIIDKEPFTELCDCGSRKAFVDIGAQLNQLIESGRLRTVCRVIK